MSARAFDLLRAVRDMNIPPPPPKLTATDKLVLIALVLRADAAGASWPSMGRLARDTWLDRSAIKRSVRRLREAGLIDVSSRSDDAGDAATNLYRVRIEVGAHDTHPGAQEPHVEADSAHPGAQGSHGGGPRNPGVGAQSTGGGGAQPPEVLREVPSGSAQGRSFALTRVEADGPKAPGAKKTPKHDAETIAAKNTIVEAFCESFKVKKGIRPKSLSAGDNAAAFRLAKTFGADEAVAIIRRAFEDSFVVEKNATLTFIASKADTFRGTTTTKPNGIRRGVMVQPAPPGGSKYQFGDGL